jgi:predicted LPLAT superfamily acyltransferase
MSEPEPALTRTHWRHHRERGSLRLLKIMTFLSLRIGRRCTRVILYITAIYFFLFAPAARRHSRAYLRRVLDRPPTAAERFRHILSFASVLHDRIFLMHGRSALFEITVEGQEILRELLQRHSGAFLLGAHLGSFEVIGAVGQRQPGLKLAMAMYEATARKVNRVFAALRPASAPEVIAIGQIEAMLRIRACLDEGTFVGILADRTLGEEPALQVPLLGSPAPLPTGPLRAAALMRSPVVFMAGLYRGGNRYHVVFEPLADFGTVEPSGRDAAITAAIHRYAALLEQCCRSDPYNWFNFYDFWNRRGD